MDVAAHISRWLSQMPELAAAELELSDAQAHVTLCTDVSALIAALQTLRSRAMAAGARARVDQQLGATSMGALVARRHGGDRREAEAEVRRGEDLLALPVTQRAAGIGDLSPRQVNLIAATMKKLPERLKADRRAACEEFLVDVARRRSLRSLRVAADRISAQWLTTEREVDVAEGEVLREREHRARSSAQFSMVSQGDGTTKGWFVLPDAQADLLRTAVEAIAAPRRDHLRPAGAGEPAHGAGYPQRLGQALCALVDHLPADRLPQSGGMAAKVVVKIDEEALRTGRGVAELSTGTRISAAQARIIAANSGIIPAVMGGRSQVLDLGRSQRLFSASQRVALSLRDGGCSFPDCDRPPAWCEAHHAREAWARGGKTDLADGTLLCWHHHRHVEAEEWEFRIAPDDCVEWVPPATVDHRRRPRRNERLRPPDLLVSA